MKKIKVMSVFGTRPEAIKMAPLVQTLAQRPEFESICCLTGQHREMLDSVMQIFRLTAQYDLNIMQKQQTLSSITTRALLGMEQALQEAQPDLVLVHGDTSTTFAGALAAFYQKVPVGHVEAGLRTYDKYSPFPEEMNRTLVSDIAALHFAPTSANVDNLRRESVQGEIFRTGNTVIDAMRTTVRPDYRFATAELNELDFKSRRVIVLTSRTMASPCMTSCGPCATSRGGMRTSRSSIPSISARPCAPAHRRSSAMCRACTSSTRSMWRRCTISWRAAASL